MRIISTHTLTWSVTRPSYLEGVVRYPISTHTLTWSVTCKTSALINSLINFNSHAHVERDFPIYGRNSIPMIYFNSHAHVERD